MPVISPAEWEAVLADHPDAHLLQTAQWGVLKAAFGWQAAALSGAGGGAQVLFRRLPLGLSLAYLPKGPVGASLADLTPELDRLCRERRAVFLKVEPDGWEGDVPEPPRGYRLSQQAIQPRRTLLVDLQGSPEQALTRMKQKTRYNIRLAEKKGVQAQPSRRIDLFSQMMQVTGQRDDFGVHSQAYYQKAYDLFHPAGMCELFLAEHQGEALAGLMVFARGWRAWYFYGASSDSQRPLMAPYLLQWEAMRWAQQRGCRVYDLWGVPDEDEAALEAGFSQRQDGLWGVYRFKRGFGGTLRRAAAPLDRVYQPALYVFYRAYLRWRGGGSAAA
jgi:lipid II:glycine glycyltransferase (peptidoglycan interpeptide bridge formation enzyme)